ncbi:RDD family protein [Streptomyces sp. SGAir0957]
MSFGGPNDPYRPQPPQPVTNPGPYGQQAALQGVSPEGYSYPQQPGMPQQGMPYGAYPHPNVPYPGMPGVPPLATMGRRLAARVIDGVPLGIINLILMAPLFVDYIDAVMKCDPDDPAAFNSCAQDAILDFYVGIIPLTLIMAGIAFLYEWLMIAFVGATLGKLAVGVRVLKVENGAKPGLASSFVRWVVPTAGIFACGFGQMAVYLSPLWDKSGRSQGWHDKAASVVVVQVKG